MNKSITWEELANVYDKNNNGRKARTLPMDSVFEWGKKRKDIFYFEPIEGTLHKLEVDE